MPDVQVEVRGNWLGTRKPEFLNAIHDALVETLRIPQDDRLLRIIEHAPNDFIIPPWAHEHFTRVEITMFAGRTLDTKRRLYRAITRNLAPFGVPAPSVKIALIEVASENWGIRGGHAGCDIDLGFAVTV